MRSSLLKCSLEVFAIALALSPTKISAIFPAKELLIAWKNPKVAQLFKLKSVLSDRTLPTSAPNSASIHLKTGIYLYGQSAKPDQIKQEYFVFEVRQGKVVGAFYLPQSAFYCFYGNVDLTQLNLTVVDTYDGTTSPYSVNLQQYYPIPTVSENDRRILGICKTAHQGEVWGK
ncbi:hypothetical protein [Tychonema sp. BBK16]|uniref:hypothetical protein n=1 Tax=Tychonema sp. BBK16 TaxID=2699888 RepID=UPI001F2F80AA|nr:hypothetical protein [Tychonema sp. BBK16]MCF6374787.1 hypothetical protein [Tychonema sp. BBK16]